MFYPLGFEGISCNSAFNMSTSFITKDKDTFVFSFEQKITNSKFSRLRIHFVFLLSKEKNLLFQ